MKGLIRQPYFWASLMVFGLWVLIQFAPWKSKPTSSFWNWKPLDGPQLSFKQAGQPSGSTLVMLHEAGGDPSQFDALMHHPELAPCFKMLAWQRPGYAEAAEPVDLAQQAAELARFLSTQPAPRILMGEGFGAVVAAQTALNYPDLVEGLLLVRLPIDPESFHLPSGATWSSGFLTSWIYSDATRKGHRELEQLPNALSELGTRWREIQTPSFIFYSLGNSDSPWRVHARAAGRVFTGAPLTLKRVDSTSQMLIRKYPDLFVTALFELLQDVKPS